MSSFSPVPMYINTPKAIEATPKTNDATRIIMLVLVILRGCVSTLSLDEALNFSVLNVNAAIYRENDCLQR